MAVGSSFVLVIFFFHQQTQNLKTGKSGINMPRDLGKDCQSHKLYMHASA